MNMTRYCLEVDGYDAFGNPEETTGSFDNPLRYAGYQYDDETGLYYLNSRYYDSSTCIF